MTKRIATFIDPPSGWKYGFPKELPDFLANDSNYPRKVNALREWLFGENYPMDMISLALQHSRYWEEEVDDE